MGIREQAKVEKQIKSDLELYDEQQIALAQLEDQLNDNPQFAQFMEARKKFAALESEVWKRVETVMLDNNLTSIKTDKLTLSIATRIGWTIDESKLPADYFKTVPDTTKITGHYKLHDEAVAGTQPKYTKYLVKRIKEIK